MHRGGEFLGVAFRRGNWRSWRDDVIMTATLGQFVHCEILLRGRAYASIDGVGGFMRSRYARHDTPEWHIVQVPVKRPDQALSPVLDILSQRLKYNTSDLWQCCVSVMLPWESELDCERPETWHGTGVFCSQVTLLLLRRLVRLDVIDLGPRRNELVEATHSRGCSPNALFHLLESGGPPPAAAVIASCKREL